MFGTRALVASLIALSTLAFAEVASADPTWVTTPTSRMHISPAAAVLGDGSVLLVGDAQTVERFDPASDRWSTMAPLSEPRSGPGAVTLRDGRVLVAGGSAGRGPVNTAELYSPTTNTWTPAESMHAWRSAAKLVLLDDGRVFAIGGYTAMAAEVYDPGTGHWTMTPDTSDIRFGATATKLADGRMLVAGGDDAPNIFGKYTYASAEIYDPGNNTWRAAAPMHVERAGAEAALLPDGRVLVAGGSNRAPDPNGSAATFEIYDPGTDTWTAPAQLPRPHRGAAMARLSDGRLVLIGGFSSRGTIGGSADNSADLFDPRTGTWTQLPPSAASRFGHIAVALADDSVLVAGGSFGPATSERLYFTTPPVRETPTPPVTTNPPPQPQPKPGVLSFTASKRLKASAVAVKVRCAGETACRGQMLLRLGTRGRTLAKAAVNVAPGKSATVRLKLKRADRRLGRRAPKVTLTFGTQKLSATLRS